MADSAQNTFAFTRALEEANRAYQLVNAYRNQQAQKGSLKRDASFLEDDYVFPITTNITSSGVTELRPLVLYPARGSNSAVFRDAVSHIDDFALPLPTVDLTQYPFTFRAPTIRMPVPPSRATPSMRARSPPTTPFVKRPRFVTPSPSDNPPSPSPSFAVHAHAILDSSSTPASSRVSDSEIAGSREEADSVSNRRVTRSGLTLFAAPRGGRTSGPSVPRTASTPSSQSIAAPFGSSVQMQNTYPLPVALPALPSGLPTPTPGLPDTRRAKHACFLQCGNSFKNVFKPGARKRGDRYGTHMFGGSDKQREKNPPCSVAVKMRWTKDEVTDEIVDVAVLGTFLLLKEPALAPRFEYPQICGRLRAALVTWYAALLSEAAQTRLESDSKGAEQEMDAPEGDDWLTDRDAEFDEELDDEDLMYE